MFWLFFFGKLSGEVLEEVGLVMSAKSCTSFGDFMFCLVDELFECFFNSVVSFGSDLFELFVGAGEGMGFVGS